MAQTAADVLVNRLVDWGVRVVFGLPGDGINGIMEVMCRSGFRLRAVGFNN
jgi:pyruvate dehydrogenase (quinone)